MTIKEGIKKAADSKPVLFNIVIAIFLVTFVVSFLDLLLPNNYILTIVYLTSAILYSVMARLFFDLKRYKFSVAFLLQVYIWVRAGILRSVTDKVGVASHLNDYQRFVNEQFLLSPFFVNLTAVIMLTSVTLMFIGISDLYKTVRSKNENTNTSQ